MRRGAPDRRRRPAVIGVPGRTDADGERAGDGVADPGEVEPRTSVGGERIHVDVGDGTRGSRGSFYPAYLDPDRQQRYGWFCSSCGSTDTAMDPMGRITCSGCENRRKATRWDAAYL